MLVSTELEPVPALKWERAAPTAISAASLPAQASAALTQMNAVSIAGLGGQAAGVAATAAGTAGASLVTPLVIVGGTLAAAAAAASNEEDTAQPAATTHH